MGLVKTTNQFGVHPNVRYACIEGVLICLVCISWLRSADQNCDPSPVTVYEGQNVILKSEVKFLSLLAA